MSRPMRPQKQKLGHKPSEDIWGDCYRTAVAVVLGLSAEEVPHFCNGQWLEGDPSGVTAARDWLKQFGLGVFTLPYPPETSFEDVMRTMRHCNPDVPVLLTGMGPRDVNHVVVTMDGEVVCDPASGNPELLMLDHGDQRQGEWQI